MKEKLILEIQEIEAKKLKVNKKKEDHIKLLREISQGTDLDELCHLVAKLKDDKVIFFYKTWICDTRGIGGIVENDAKYELVDISTFDEEKLKEILNIVKSSDYPL
ncbi:hypothetical protein [uncultured Fusobacterium sp.]|jgi:hypothetical protein|uniref:hypothetical protein n=1 Tax=uncultured Fusobacterium sp. TaxID=159267 RepID=UPI00205A913B|nr:hypothetical protein [uncultured Fusobacterium sp.]DAV44378.1 MAG TPA: hypothetical protein [Caudoviricetes sp.]